MKTKMKFTRDQLIQTNIALTWYSSMKLQPWQDQVAQALAQELSIKIQQALVIVKEKYSMKLQYSQATLVQSVMVNYSEWMEWNEETDYNRKHNIRTTIHLLDGAIKGSS